MKNTKELFQELVEKCGTNLNDFNSAIGLLDKFIEGKLDSIIKISFKETFTASIGSIILYHYGYDSLSPVDRQILSSTMLLSNGEDLPVQSILEEDSLMYISSDMITHSLRKLSGQGFIRLDLLDNAPSVQSAIKGGKVIEITFP